MNSGKLQEKRQKLLNNKRIAERGYISLVSYYNKVHIKL